MNRLKLNFLIFFVIFIFPFNLALGSDRSWSSNEGGGFFGYEGYLNYSDTLVPTVYLVSVNDTVSPQSSCGFNVRSDRINKVVINVQNVENDSFTVDVRAFTDDEDHRIDYRNHATMPCTIEVHVGSWPLGTDSMFVWVVDEISGDTLMPGPLIIELCVLPINIACVEIVAPKLYSIPCSENPARFVPIWAHLVPGCQDTMIVLMEFRCHVNMPGHPWYYIGEDIILPDDGYWKIRWNNANLVEDGDSVYLIAIGYDQYHKADTSSVVMVSVDCQVLNAQLSIENVLYTCFGKPKVAGLINLKAVDDTLVQIHSVKFYYKLTTDPDIFPFWHYIGEGEQLSENVYIYRNFNTLSLIQNVYYDFRAVGVDPMGNVMFDFDEDGRFDDSTFILALAQGSAKIVFVDNQSPQPAFSMVADSESSVFNVNPSLLLGGNGKAYVKASDEITTWISVIPSMDTGEVLGVEYYIKGYGDTTHLYVDSSTYPSHFPISFEPISDGLIPPEQLEDGWWRGQIWALLHDSLGNTKADTINLFVLDILPFQAIIVDPLNDSYVASDVPMTVAALNPYEISQVTYQYKQQDSIEWNNILNGTSMEPDSFPIIWQISDIPPGIYFLRAVAKDSAGIADSLPPTIRVLLYSRGDANGDGTIGIDDVVYIVNYLYKDGSAPIPSIAGDVNCDDIVDIGDIVYLINFLFKNGDPPCSP
jgi:hypothetical protein